MKNIQCQNRTTIDHTLDKEHTGTYFIIQKDKGMVCETQSKTGPPNLFLEKMHFATFNIQYKMYLKKAVTEMFFFSNSSYILGLRKYKIRKE